MSEIKGALQWGSAVFILFICLTMIVIGNTGNECSYNISESLNPIENQDCLGTVPIDNGNINLFEFDLIIHSHCKDDDLCLFFYIGNETSFDSAIVDRYCGIWLTKEGFYVLLTDYFLNITLSPLLLDTLYSFKIEIFTDSYAIFINQVFHYQEYDEVRDRLSNNVYYLPLFINNPLYQAANITISNIKMEIIDTISLTSPQFTWLWIAFILFVAVCIMPCCCICCKAGIQHQKKLNIKKKQREAAESKANYIKWKLKMKKVTKYINNPMVIFFGIEFYEEEPKNPAIDGYCKHLDAVSVDYHHIKKFCKQFNYDLHPKKMKLEWTQNEIIAKLKKYAQMIGNPSSSYDSILLITSSHGLQDSIITSDYQLILTTAIHRLFTLNYPSTRHIPRIFLFDCCNGDQQRSTYYADFEEESSSESDEGKNITYMQDIKFSRFAFGRRLCVRQYNPNVLDSNLVVVRAANVGFQAICDAEKGSYLIINFLKQMSLKINNEEVKEDSYLGDIICNMQNELHSMGKQLITPTFSPETCRWIVFEKNDNDNNHHHDSVGDDNKDDDKDDDTSDYDDEEEKYHIFYSDQTLEDVKEIVKEYDDDKEKKENEENYLFNIAEEIGKYFEKMFNDKNNVVIVSKGNAQPQVSSNDISVERFDRIIKNINNKEIRIFRVVKQDKLDENQQQYNKSSFQQIVIDLAMTHVDVNKMANQLIHVYGSGCHVARACDYNHSYEIYCKYSNGLITRHTSSSAFIIAWKR